jgi:hypothetical protein
MQSIEDGRARERIDPLIFRGNSTPHHGFDFSWSLTLPPLAVIWLAVQQF